MLMMRQSGSCPFSLSNLNLSFGLRWCVCRKSTSTLVPRVPGITWLLSVNKNSQFCGSYLACHECPASAPHLLVPSLRHDDSLGKIINGFALLYSPAVLSSPSSLLAFQIFFRLQLLPAVLHNPHPHHGSQYGAQCWSYKVRSLETSYYYYIC